MIQQLLGKIQAAQNLALDTAILTPDGTYGKAALNLGWEALRLGWYMVKGDRVGISEKTYYVKLAYKTLMEELEDHDR
jgi:hypothetical protein